MATNVHIEGIGDVIATIRTDMDSLQRGAVDPGVDPSVSNNSWELCWMNDDADELHFFNRWETVPGAVTSYKDVTWNDISVNGDLSIAEYLYHLGDSDTYIRFEADKQSFEVGGVTMLDMVEGANDYMEFNSGELDVNFVVNTVSPDSLFIEGSSGKIAVNHNSPANFFHIYVDNTDTLNTADQSQLIIEQDGAGDASIQFELTGGTVYSLGTDNSDPNDAFTLHEVGGPDKKILRAWASGASKPTLWVGENDDPELTWDSSVSNVSLTHASGTPDFIAMYIQHPDSAGLAFECYFDDTDERWEYANNGDGSLRIAFDPNGQDADKGLLSFIFGYDSSHSADDAVTETTRLTLNADGQMVLTGALGIGTAPAVSALLYVNAADGVCDNALAAFIKNGEETDDRSFGLQIQAGSTANDYCLRLEDHDGSNEILTARGNGDVIVPNGQMGIGNSPSNNMLLVQAADGVCDNQRAAFIQNAEATDDRSLGVEIAAGSTSVDYALLCRDHDQSNVLFHVRGDGGILCPNMKSGTSQVDAGAAAHELWHDTCDDTVKIGV